MRRLKTIALFLSLMWMVGFALAQTEVTVVENSGTSATFVVSDLGKIYFSAERMYVDAGDGTVNDFAVSDIKKLTFNSLYSGVNSMEHRSSALIYPNPATNFIRIATDDQQTLHVRLYALTGQLLSDSYCQPNEEVNISHLPSGIYFVKVNDMTYKLLKK